MGVTRDVRKLMAAADPAADLRVDEERARADLEAILARAPQPGPARQPWRPPRWLTVAAGATAVAALAAVLTVLPGDSGGTGDGGTGYTTASPLPYEAATAERPADELLGEIADRAAAQPEPDGRAVEIRYLEWTLAQTSDEPLLGMEADVRNRLSPDGTVTQTRKVLGATTTSEYGPTPYMQPAPADPEEFRAWLESAHGVPVAAPIDLTAAMHDLLTVQDLGPQQRAAFLRMLADMPGLTYDGEATDRAGRHVQAFSLTSSKSGEPTRYTFLIDPATGRVLGQEATLTEAADEPDLPLPFVISYQVYFPALRDG